MKVNVDWEVFHAVFYNSGTVFVHETDKIYEFYTADGMMIIHCIKKKSLDDEDNIMFVERYMTNKKNIIKVLSFEGYEDVKKPRKPKETKEEVGDINDDMSNQEITDYLRKQTKGTK